MQGPHHVANQSTTTTGFLAMVSLKAAALEGTLKTRGQYRGTRIGCLELQLQCQLQAASCRTRFGRPARASRQSAAACFCVAGGPRAGQREDNSRLNVVDSHLGQCGVE